jgi:hypothetical protein
MTLKEEKPLQIDITVKIKKTRLLLGFGHAESLDIGRALVEGRIIQVIGKLWNTHLKKS